MNGDVSRLLARGGRILGLAAVAHSSATRDPGQGWYVLSPEIASAAEGILGVLRGGVGKGSLGAAIGAAMGSGPATACPGWAEPLVDRPSLLKEIGRRVRVNPEVARSEGRPVDDRLCGLAAIGMALCRSVDSAAALARRLPPADGEILMRLSRYAQAVAEPNEPSETRSRIREALRDG